jgi:hypothetical protein
MVCILLCITINKSDRFFVSGDGKSITKLKNFEIG